MSLFFRRGSSATYFVPTVSNPASPSGAEISAGTELGMAVTALAGFGTSLNRINVPVQKYKEAIQIDGPQTFSDTTITLLDDDGTGTDPDQAGRVAAALALAEGTVGYIVLLPTSTTPTSGIKAEVWPIRVGAVNPVWALDEEPARTEYSLTVTTPPTKNATVAGA